MTGEILYDSRYGQLTPEVAEKIRKSREEVKKLKSRTLRCPVCGFRLEEPLNLAYFRRIKKSVLVINPYIIGKIKR